MGSEIPSFLVPPTPAPKPLKQTKPTKNQKPKQRTQISLGHFYFSIEKVWVKIVEVWHSFQEEIENQPMFGIDASVYNLFLAVSDQGLVFNRAD